jgi:hypothetical protein
VGTVLDHIQDGLFLRFVERMPVPQGSIRSVAEDVRRRELKNPAKNCMEWWWMIKS